MSVSLIVSEIFNIK